MRNYVSLILALGISQAQAQVVNEVSVYIKPGTEVHIFESLTNSNSGNLEVGEEALLYVDGVLSNNGTITFENDASLMRGANSTDGGSGTYQVKQSGYFGAGYNMWSSPVAANSSVPGTVSYQYIEANGTQFHGDDYPSDPGWASYNGTMTPGKGYAGSAAGNYTFSDNEANNGTITIGLHQTPFDPSYTSVTGGTPFNLVGNPYPSGLDCQALVTAGANSGVHGSLYFWIDDGSAGGNYSASDYAIWNLVGNVPNTANANGSATPNGYMKTGQGFMIRNTNSANLTFNNAMRVTNTMANAFFRVNAEESRLWFSINGPTPAAFNQILVGVLDDATDGEDRLYDAVKVKGNTAATLVIESEETDYAIMAFPPPAVSRTYPLNVFVAEDETYTFKADEMIGFENLDVYFVDTKSASPILLEENTEITLSLEEGEYTDRFYLNFVPNSMVGLEENETETWNSWIFNEQLNVQLSGYANEDLELQLLDMSGKTILNSNINGNLETNRISVSGIAEGVYVVRIVGKDVSLAKTVVKR